MSETETQQTVLGPNCTIEGDLTLDGDGTIMGKFHGTLRINGIIELTDSANVSGTVVAGAMRLGGHAEADIVAEHGVELLAGCDLKGRLFTNRLSVVDGAEFEGEVVIGPKAMNAANDVLRRIESQEKDRSQQRSRAGWSGDARDRAGDVETVPNSLDKILQQHRARRPTADSKPQST